MRDYRLELDLVLEFRIQGSGLAGLGVRSITVLLENSVDEMIQDSGNRAVAHPDVDVVKPLDGVRCHQHGGGACSWRGALRVMPCYDSFTESRFRKSGSECTGMDRITVRQLCAGPCVLFHFFAQKSLEGSLPGISSLPRHSPHPHHQHEELCPCILRGIEGNCGGEKCL